MNRRTQSSPQLQLRVVVFVCLAVLSAPHGGSATMQAPARPMAGPLQVETQQPRFESSVELVVLPVSVLDSDDLPAAGLTRGDFLVFEDDSEQEVALLLSPEEAPLDIALLMDASSSMSSMEEAAKSSAVAFLDRLSDDDCVFLLRFRETPGLGIWGLTSDPRIREAIKETPLEGGTALRDGLAMGFYHLEEDLDRCWVSNSPFANSRDAHQRRPALVVVTDGLDEHSVRTFDSLLSIARQADAPFLPVGFGAITLPTPVLREAQSDAAFSGVETRLSRAARGLSELQGLARVTGGRFIRGGNNLEKLSAAYEEVIRWLRSYYLIGYYPGSRGAAQRESQLPSWHEVEVRLRRPGYQIQTRGGYYRMPIDVLAAHRHVETGTNLIAKGETDRALDELDMAVRADPYSWEAHYRRGEALILAGEPHEAQKALVRAAELSPGRGDVHELACRMSLELADYETAWDQAIRAHQAEVNVTEELLLLRQEATVPANLDERLQAPHLYIESFGSIDPIEEAALRILHLALAQRLSEVPEVGFIDLEALADYQLLIKLKELSESSPHQLEADLELREMRSTGSDRVYRRGVTIFDIEDRERITADLAPHIIEILNRLSERRR